MLSVIRKSTPLPGDMHVNTPLTNMAVAYVQDSRQFIAGKVFPSVGVQKQSDLFYKWNKETFLSAFAKKRAPSTETVGGNMDLTTDSYLAEVYGYHFDIDDQQRANADAQINLERAATQHVMNALLLEFERAWTAAYFKSAVWATDFTPAVLWSAGALSTPRKDMEVAKMTVLKNTGKMPNTLVMGRQVVSALYDNPVVRDQFKYTSASSINLAMLAAFFDVERIYVADAVATLDGGATYDFLAGKHALLTYVNPNPGIMEISSGYTFGWTGYTGSVDGVRISKFREEKIKSDRIEGEYAFAHKLVAADLGYMFVGAVV